MQQITNSKIPTTGFTGHYHPALFGEIPIDWFISGIGQEDEEGDHDIGQTVAEDVSVGIITGELPVGAGAGEIEQGG